jgi:hypothetical protein
VCAWDFETGEAEISERFRSVQGRLVVGELDHFGFVVAGGDEDTRYRILVGDVTLAEILSDEEEASGRIYDNKVIWREAAYFESGRGATTISVQSRSVSDSSQFWETRIRAEIYVVPSKLGEDGYRSMSADLARVSRGLLVDLYGKSTQMSEVRDSARGAAVRLPHEELLAIEQALDGLEPAIAMISRRPLSVVRSRLELGWFWGAERLSPIAINFLSRRGFQVGVSERPARVLREVRSDSFDVPEHQAIRAVLESLRLRARYCQEVALNDVQAIEADRDHRDVRFGAAPSLFEVVDRSRLRRLEGVIRRSRMAEFRAQALLGAPVLRESSSRRDAIEGGRFERSAEYRGVLRLLKNYMARNVAIDDSRAGSQVTKLTSKLFEQWCFVRVVDAFRTAGLDLREWSSALRQHLVSRYLLDFERGLNFEGQFDGGYLRLRIRCEPWILSEAGARRAGETLFRGSSGDTPWSPDIVIECQRYETEAWRTVYAIVMDSKYVNRLTQAHWHRTAKYLEIRRTFDRRQIVRQLWLVTACEDNTLSSEDPAVGFGSGGPTCANDEAVRFSLSVAPTHAGSPGGETDAFSMFASGTLSFLVREFGRRP